MMMMWTVMRNIFPIIISQRDGRYLHMEWDGLFSFNCNFPDPYSRTTIIRSSQTMHCHIVHHPFPMILPRRTDKGVLGSGNWRFRRMTARPNLLNNRQVAGDSVLNRTTLHITRGDGAMESCRIQFNLLECFTVTSSMNESTSSHYPLCCSYTLVEFGMGWVCSN